jgi:hypothetical protein
VGRSSKHSYPEFAGAVGIPRVARNDNLSRNDNVEDLRPSCQGLKVGRNFSMLSFYFIQQHRDLFDDLDVESFEGWNFSGMVS